MSAQQRELIKEYLHAGFSATHSFSRIELGRTPLDSYRSPEGARFLALWRDEERFLVVVHADATYRPKQEEFLRLYRDMSAHDIACVSVFDDREFYQWDEGPFKPSRQGTYAEKAKRIKLLGLERVAQKLGPLVYYKNNKPALEVVQFSGGVIADYSKSRRTPEWIHERELLTVMDPHVLARLEDRVFDLRDSGVVQKDVRLACFAPVKEEKSSAYGGIPENWRELLVDGEEEKNPPDAQQQFILDELDGGRDPKDLGL